MIQASGQARMTDTAVTVSVIYTDTAMARSIGASVKMRT